MRAWRAGATGLALLCFAAPASAQYNPNGGYNPNGAPGNNYTTGGASGQANNRGGATEQQLRRSEQDDSGRGLEWFYLSVGGGVQYLNPTAFSHSGDLLRDKSASGAGPSGSVALGARLLTLTIGVRGRLDSLSEYQHLSIDPEIGLHLPSGDFEPYFLLGGGYSRLLGVSESLSMKPIGGFNIRLAGGFDYYVTKFFTVGALVNFEMIHLGRDAYEISKTSTSQDENGNPVTTVTKTTFEAASALGIAVGGTLVLGLHFLGRIWSAIRRAPA